MFARSTYVSANSDTDDSEDEDEAVKLAKQKFMQPKKSQAGFLVISLLRSRVGGSFN